MYARITRMVMDPTRSEEVQAKLDSVTGEVAALPGLRLWISTGDWESGAGYSVAVYDSKESAEAASAQVQQILGGFAEYMTAPPEVVLHEVGAHLIAD